MVFAEFEINDAGERVFLNMDEFESKNIFITPFQVGEDSIPCGSTGCAYEVKYENVPDPCILKLTRVSKENINQYKKELELTNMASEINIGPTLYVAFTMWGQTSDQKAMLVGCIVMEKLETTINRHVVIDETFITELKQLIDIKNNHLLLHNDLHMANIMGNISRRDGDNIYVHHLRFIDWGSSSHFVLESENNTDYLKIIGEVLYRVDSYTSKRLDDDIVDLNLSAVSYSGAPQFFWQQGTLFDMFMRLDFESARVSDMFQQLVMDYILQYKQIFETVYQIQLSEYTPKDGNNILNQVPSPIALYQTYYNFCIYLCLLPKPL